MAELTLRFTVPLWEHSEEAPWVFATLPPEESDEVDSNVPNRRGFGSVPVTATIGTTVWQTSLFPDKASHAFLLPIKREVREAEGLSVGDRVQVLLAVDAD